VQLLGSAYFCRWRKRRASEEQRPGEGRSVAGRWFGAGRSRVIVGKCEGKRQLGRTGLRRDDKVKMYLEDIELEGADWINLAQDRDKWQAVVNAVMKLLLP